MDMIYTVDIKHHECLVVTQYGMEHYNSLASYWYERLGISK